MSRWFDCPICLGYCEEWICDCCGLSRCEACGLEVNFVEAPEEVKNELYRAGLWCEEMVVVKDEDGEQQAAPAFNSKEEYDRYIEWNSIGMRAEYDQLVSLLNDNSDDGKPLFTVGEYTICFTTSEEDENLGPPKEHVRADLADGNPPLFELDGDKYGITEQGLSVINDACEKGKMVALDLFKNGKCVSVVCVVGKREMKNQNGTE